MKKEIIFIDEDTLTPEEWEASTMSRPMNKEEYRAEL